MSGPFASFVHRHSFAPLGPLGAIADLALRGYMERLLRTRDAALAAEAGST